MAEKLYKVKATEYRVFEETLLAASRVDAQETLESHIRHDSVKPKKTTIVYDEVKPYKRYFASADVKYSSNYAVVDRLFDRMIGEFFERTNAERFANLLNEEEE